MLFVRTKVAKSSIQGLGLFADEFIPKGTVVWKFTKGFDLKFNRNQILDFPATLQAYIYKYCWKSKKSGLYCFSSDNGKYFNHSDDPNVLSEYRDDEDEVVTVAIKNIYPGQEIVDDYSSFDDDNTDDNVLDEIARKLHLHEDFNPYMKSKLNA